MELPEVIGKEAVKLPEHLDTSLRGLKQARTLLASGDITLVALAARMAFERAIIWLERVEQINLKPFQSARRDIHQVRAEAAAAVLGVASKDLHRLLAHSEADEYGVTLPGKPLRYGAAHAEGAILIAAQTLQMAVAFGESRGLLTEAQAAVAGAEIERTGRSGIEELLRGAYRDAVDGKLGPQVPDQLSFLVSATARPSGASGRALAGRVSTVSAWAALNRGITSGLNGALAWSQRAAEMLSGVIEQRALTEALIIAAIAHRQEGRHKEALRSLRHAQAVAGSHRELREDVRTQQVLTAIDLNPDGQTVMTAEDIVHKAEELGEPTWVANQRMMVGRVLDAAGQPARAEEALHAGLRGQTHAHAMSRCVGMRYLMWFYEKRGVREEAIRWAKRLKRTAAPRGLGRYVKEANEVLKRH